MKKWVISIFILIVGAVALQAKSAEESAYKGLSNFTRVLDLIERNYVENVDAEKLSVAAIEGMVKSLDPYSAYLSPERYRDLEIGTSGEFGGVGMEVTVENNVLTVLSPLEGTPADKAGIKAGDQILAIDGKPTRGMVTDEAVSLLRGAKDTPVKVTIKSKDRPETKDITLIREVIRVKSVKYELVGTNIGYIRVAQFQEKTSEELQAAVLKLEALNGGKLKGLILDLRNNPGGLLDEAVEMVDEFIDKGLIVSVRGRSKDQSTEYYATKEGRSVTYPMIVIVNKGSASASEVVAEALQDSKRAVILGTKTFGKGSVQTIIRLDDGAGLKLTTAKFYAPSGRSISQVGVVPDVIVEEKDEPKGKDNKPVTEDKDEPLEKSIEILKSNGVNRIIHRG